MRLLAAAGGGRPVKEVWRNWSNNHVSKPIYVYRPATQQELEFILQLHNARKEPLTCVGAGLSPNGLAFGVGHAISLSNMNQVVYIDAERKQAKFQCGITIQEVVDALKPHGLMLPNLASINLQQLGGFYSVGAHGTGRNLPPVEEQILSLTLATPTGRVVELDRTCKWFPFAQLSLGLLGVVMDVTVQLVDIYKMKQTKQVFPVDSLTKQQFRDLVMGNDHVKFMWYPHENKTVACYSNRTEEEPIVAHSEEEDGLKEMRDLYSKLHGGKETKETCFADLRALLLRGKSLDLEAVKQINAAEVKFHENTQGCEVAEADKFMAFDCGGSQLVYEFSMKFDPEACRDFDLVHALLARIQKEGLPAPGPIEHRFTSGSRAKMSPAHGTEHDIYSWIGIVMYIPQGDDDKEEIKDMFARYCEVTKAVAKDMQIDIRVHWAKLEIPATAADDKLQQKELRELYPVDEFNELRREVDPNHVFQTEWSLAMFGKH